MYLLLGAFSLCKVETSSDDILIEKLCENIYWEIAHLSLVVSLYVHDYLSQNHFLISSLAMRLWRESLQESLLDSYSCASLFISTWKIMREC